MRDVSTMRAARVARFFCRREPRAEGREPRPGIIRPARSFPVAMRKLGSLLLTLAFVGLVPALAAAELSMPESCCTSSDAGMSAGVACCEMVSCSMSPRPDPVRAPNHRGTTPDTQKLPQPQAVTLPVAVVADATAATCLDARPELVDPSPPPTTSERLAVISWYLI